VKTINYSEGDCFVVPLRNGGFARGIVVRMDKKGRIFANFFGPRFPAKDIRIVDENEQGSKLFSGFVGDLGIIQGKWPVLGKVKP
jgi:hypothetical protein